MTTRPVVAELGPIDRLRSRIEDHVVQVGMANDLVDLIRDEVGTLPCQSSLASTKRNRACSALCALEMMLKSTEEGLQGLARELKSP